MMDEFPNVLCGGWSWEENKLFELALAVIGEEDPNRWGLVAAMVGGNKNPEDVQRHYVALLQDVDSIESGHLDHKLGDAAAPPYNDSTQSTSYLTDEAQSEKFDHCSFKIKEFSLKGGRRVRSDRGDDHQLLLDHNESFLSSKYTDLVFSALEGAPIKKGNCKMCVCFT